ncbi:MAG: hypothetical protein M9918_11320 [Anaerolineae bacterium]|nr:hypothetical protein [Anaerolineae bacterium]
MFTRYTPRLIFCFFFGIVLVTTACTGQTPEQGPVGPAGPAGPMGPVGPAGTDATAAQTFVGAEECGSCHEEIYARYQTTGHARALTAIDSSTVETVLANGHNGIDMPPDGYVWEDIAYMIGGFGWMARFVDSDGYLISGPSSQYNFENELLETDAAWAAYDAADDGVFTCGACHTTGYAEQGHQNNLAGVAGAWAFDGVQCERCHGPGSLHAENPQGVTMSIDRDSQACGSCHVRDERATIDAEGGFAEHNQQFSDLYNSQHFALSCVTCHDPHMSTVSADDELNPNAGIAQRCESCHWEQESVRKVRRHLGVDCIDCHMPFTAVSAVADSERLMGDIRSHQFAINTSATAEQFSDDGTQMQPYLTLAYVCTQCHNGDTAPVLSAEELSTAATGYHTPVVPTATPEPVPQETATPEP